MKQFHTTAYALRCSLPLRPRNQWGNYSVPLEGNEIFYYSLPRVSTVAPGRSGQSVRWLDPRCYKRVEESVWMRNVAEAPRRHASSSLIETYDSEQVIIRLFAQHLPSRKGHESEAVGPISHNGPASR